MGSLFEIPEVRPLRPRHPADQLRLLYWLCFDPARLRQYGEQNLSETLLWLVSTLVWSLAAIIKLGDQPPHVTTLLLLLVGWWVTSRYGAKRILRTPLANVFLTVGILAGWPQIESDDATFVKWLLTAVVVRGVAYFWELKYMEYMNNTFANYAGF